MLGRRNDPQVFYEPPARFERRLPLASEVRQAQPLLFALQRLVLELCGWLRGRGAGVQAFDILLWSVEGRRSRVTVRMRRESRDPERLNALLRERLQRLELPQAVGEVGLRAEWPMELDARSLDLFEAADESSRVDLVDRLRARLGDQAVRGISAVAEHRPEHAWQYSEPGSSREHSNDRCRPLWLLPVAQPLRTRDGRPCFHGELELQPGRERIESGWWDGQDVARDYFVAVNPAGCRYWIYRELSGERRWYLQGVFE
jgi:protein ImuB